jgi:hypothetical protein
VFEPKDAKGNAIWYFAYGSNMSPAIFVERRGMRPLATRRARLDAIACASAFP